MSKKTAICFSGELRSIDQNISLFEERIFSRFSDYDIFYFTWSDDPDITKLSIIENLPNTKEVKIEERLTFDLNYFAPNLGFTTQASIRQLYCLMKTNDIRQQYSNNNNINYDIVVHIRPDLRILNNTYLDTDIENYDMNFLYKLDHDNWRGYSDRFYISNENNMNIITGRLNNYRNYSLIGGIKPYEEFLKYIIDINDIETKNLSLKTCLLRTSGQLLGEEISLINGDLVKIDNRLYHNKLQYWIN